MDGLDRRSLQATWAILPATVLRDLGSCCPRESPACQRTETGVPPWL